MPTLTNHSNDNVVQDIQGTNSTSASCRVQRSYCAPPDFADLRNHTTSSERQQYVRSESLPQQPKSNRGEKIIKTKPCGSHAMLKALPLAVNSTCDKISKLTCGFPPWAFFFDSFSSLCAFHIPSFLFSPCARTLLIRLQPTSVPVDAFLTSSKSCIMLKVYKRPPAVKYMVDLVVGKNTIMRNSRDFFWSVRDRTMYTDLYKKMMMSITGKDKFILDMSEAHCGFPDRLILPKGWTSGMQMQMYFILTPYTMTEVKNDVTFDKTYMCGLTTHATNGLPLRSQNRYDLLVHQEHDLQGCHDLSLG
ncbi:hexamerin 2 beta [Culex quinquefasciatus]|uniref:Hexamerin 2 beta n=1 Tax=Culex quinquefasciatus TaxID=7176 RepID=B0WB40_CULQU|nr:hexamerin 2 beta [Culex quinquefasciatus]|eukprot:XP_001845924.1 hexamerin 2 beta [Culex quinquefasciatus]